MKKILICNGNPKENTDFDGQLAMLEKSLTAHGNSVKTITLREKNIGDCIGCYACWLKTPGICAQKDDQAEVLKGYVWADFVIVASPLIMGFVSALAKKMTDRLIPLVHPYLRMNEDRMSHYSRYQKSFSSCLLLDAQPDEETKEILGKIFSNAAFIRSVDENTEVIADEINNL
jgi:multimeric flavodoxin WrbA